MADQPIRMGKEACLDDARDLSDESFKRLVAHRARQVIPEFSGAEAAVLPPLKDTEKRKTVEAAIADSYERVHKGADFLPASFLVDGAERAKAVCRIETAGSYGTGFLVGPGILLTNNHVLPSKVVARGSVADFDYQDGGQQLRVALDPDALFLTNNALDFTFVGCVEEELAALTPIELRRDPTLVTRNERVNIIQHPRGRRKEVALHENRVVRVMDRVLRYQTDTEPGSSGSPVFNNEWDLVALHHAGWEVEDGGAENEGILISAIVAYLLGMGGENYETDSAVRRILDTVNDTSPYLGFFDAHGTTSDWMEVEVPTYTGSRDFIDIGFWNIEHFNDNISDERVRDVADVVARLSMDVLGLTEVQQGALERLKTELGSHGQSYGHVYLNAYGSQDLAVLYDRETTEVTLRNDITQRHEDKLSRRTSAGRTVFPRWPLFAECKVGEGDDELKLLLIVVHLKAFGDAASRERRRMAAEILADIIANVGEQDGLAVVLGGDFNERLDTDVLAALVESPDLVSLTADDATGDAISYVGTRHRSLIDHIMVSSDVKLGTIAGDDAAIVRLDQSVADFADRVSDHVPVVIRAIYRDEPVVVEPSTDGPVVEIPDGAQRVRVSFE